MDKILNEIINKNGTCDARLIKGFDILTNNQKKIFIEFIQNFYLSYDYNAVYKPSKIKFQIESNCLIMKLSNKSTLKIESPDKWY